MIAFPVLRDALERYQRDRDHPGSLQPLIDGLEPDWWRAVREFQRLAGGLREVPEGSLEAPAGRPESRVRR